MRHSFSWSTIVLLEPGHWQRTILTFTGNCRGYQMISLQFRILHWDTSYFAASIGLAFCTSNICTYQLCYETRQTLLPCVQYSIAFLSPMINDCFHNRWLPKIFEIFGHAIDTPLIGNRFFWYIIKCIFANLTSLCCFLGVET